MRRFSALLTALALVGGLFAFAQESKADDEGFRLDHKTLYFAPGIIDAHRFEIEGAVQGGMGTGKLTIDPNTCSLNEFGDRGACTRIAPPVIPVEFRQLRLTDPCMTSREVYSVAGRGIPEGYKFTLVIGRKTKPEVLRLVVEANDARSAFPLVPRKECDQVPGDSNP